MDQELFELYAADQADRRNNLPSPAMLAHDADRRQRVAELIAAGALQAPEDYYHAAMVFQHGATLADFWRAHDLARQAAEMGAVGSRWLAAAAYDRWLTNQGKPQKYGTQYRAEGDRWVLEPVDPATTDTERTEWDVPPLAEALRRAEQLTKDRPPVGHAEQLTRDRPPVRQAPQPVAALAVEGLQVEVSPAPATPLPDLTWEPLRSDDPPAPAGLPAGLLPCRLPQGFGATDATGRLRLLWGELALHDGEPFRIMLPAAEDPVPFLQPVDVAGHTGVLVAATRVALIVWRSSPGTCRVVSGDIAPVELLALARSLVPGAS